MKRTKLVLAAGLVLILMLACATIGGGGDQNDNQANQQQNQNNNDQQDQNTNNNDANNNQSDNTSDNNDTNNNQTGSGFGGEGALWDTDFGKLLESGDLAIEEIFSNSSGETVGEILTIQFTNPSTDEIIVTLPCGLVFTPASSDEQALMLVQALEITLAGGGTAEFNPFVVCIDSSASAPAMNSAYTVGYLESGDLLAFAECVCGEQISLDVESMDAIGVQFAAWSISSGEDLLSLGEEENSAFQDFLTELDASGMGELVTEMMEMFGGEWLDRCGITIGE